MSAPVITWIIIQSLTVGVCVANHGKPRGRFNALDSIVGAFIVDAILYWGGWFS